MKKFGSIALGTIVLILTSFLMVNAEFAFPGQGQSIQLVMMIYLILFVIGLTYTLVTKSKATSQIDNTVKMNIYSIGPLVLGGGITYVFALMFPAAILAGFDVIQIAAMAGFSLSFILIYVFVKAYIEEVFFRVFLLEQIGWKASIILFGLFHLAVLSIGGPSLISLAVAVGFLMVLGLIWTFMIQTKELGFNSALGSHFIWNLHAIGVI